MGSGAIERVASPVTFALTDNFCYYKSVVTDIDSVLQDQNPWWSDPKRRESLAFPHRRDVFDRVLTYFGDANARRAAALLGPRQVGKTTLLLQAIDELLGRGWPPANITFFDFSDERLTSDVSPREVVASRPVGLSPDVPRAFLFDEIQLASGWQNWLKAAVDQSRRDTGPGARLVVTGSAASSLRHGGVESGQGRWDEIPIEGLTFPEFLRLASPPGASLIVRNPQVLDRYLEVGGFPEHLSPETSAREARRRIREDIADRAILRDLLRTGADVERLRRLFVYLVNDSGSTWNQGNRASDLDANRKTVSEWLSVLEGTCLLTRLERDSHAGMSAKAALRSQPKVFASDHGLITAFSPHPDPLSNSETRARVFEAVVFRHLRELARPTNAVLSFGRLDDDLEVDFIIRYRDTSVGVEVTSSPEARSRKIGRAEETISRLGLTRGLLIHGGVRAQESGGLSIVPLHEFLLDPARYAGGSP